MWMVVRIPAGEVTNLHYIFVVAKPLVDIKEIKLDISSGKCVQGLLFFEIL